MRLIVSGGGTGGHVYPNMAILAALREPPFNLAAQNVLYLGIRGRADERLVPQAGYPFAAIPSGAVLGRGPATLARSAANILLGFVQALRHINRFRPDAMLATGGYVSVPAALAGWTARVPMLVYLPDAEPGLAVRLEARLATRVAVTVPPRIHPLPAKKLAFTGYPVRPGLGTITKEEGSRYWGLDPSVPTVLVWGGSQGARAVNEEIVRHLDSLLVLCQLLHVVGEGSEDAPVASHPRYVFRSYLTEGVPEALGAADLVVSRAGASVLGEFPAARLPSILVPYPYAGAHQALNAKFMVDAGAAIMLTEDRVAELVPTIERLLADEARLQAMSQAAGLLARPNAAAEIASLLARLAGSRAPEAAVA